MFDKNIVGFSKPKNKVISFGKTQYLVSLILWVYVFNVILKFKDYGSREISEYMHKERAYQETMQDEIISFEYSKDLISF